MHCRTMALMAPPAQLSWRPPARGSHDSATHPLRCRWEEERDTSGGGSDKGAEGLFDGGRGCSTNNAAASSWLRVALLGLASRRHL